MGLQMWRKCKQETLAKKKLTSRVKFCVSLLPGSNWMKESLIRITNAPTQIQYKNGQYGCWAHLCLNDTNQVKQMADCFGNGT